MAIEGRFIDIWHAQHANPVHTADQRNQTPGDIFGAVAVGKRARRAAKVYQVNHFDMPHFEGGQISPFELRIFIRQQQRFAPQMHIGFKTTFIAAQHDTALGVWAAIGSGGAAFGPLIGGILLEHFYWGSVFLLNVPIVIGVMILTARYVPRQAGRAEQPLHLNQALVLIVAILLLVWSAKTAMKGTLPLWMIVGTLISGTALLTGFVRIQLAAATPMIDMRLFTHRVILTGALMAITAMVTLVGFELLMAQELQFVHGFTPFAAGMFMLPLMLASGFGGPIAGILVSKLGLRRVATGGMALSALSFLGLSMTDFATQPWQAGSLMALLGFSAASALLASTAAIMAAAPPEKAAAAGAIESMAYELGAGLGIAVFGLILSRSFAASIQGAGCTTADGAANH